MKDQATRVKLQLVSTTLIGAGLIAILFLFISLDAVAGTLVPPQVVAIFPGSNSHDAEVTTPISITYDQDMNPITINPNSFVVHARQTGWLTDMPTVDGGMIMLQPDDPLHAGELVQVSATTHTLSMDGEGPVKPTVWEFTTAPWGGNAYFHEAQTLVNDAGREAALGDLDGDGDLDAIAVSCNLFTRIYHNDGSGTFTQVQVIFYDTCILDVDLGDLDGDGDLDAMLVSLSFTTNKVLMNDGTGHFIDSGQYIASQADTYGELGDLDGDGDLDFFVASGGFETGTLRVWQNDGDGIFSLANDFDTAYEHTGTALGDLDEDGDLDAFTTGWNNSYNKVWLNDGTGAFTEAQSIPYASSYTPLLGDLDGDGDLDVYLANITYDVTDLPDEIWLNDGSGQFTDSGQSLETIISAIPALGDLDADGDLDVYISGEIDVPAPDEVWANNGSGEFTLFRIMDENYPGGITNLGDLDNDSNLDAFTISQFWEVGFKVFLNGDWTQVAPSHVPLAANLVQCPEIPGSFYMVGGILTGNITSNRLYHYDIADGEWEQLTSMPSPRRAVAAACYHGMIYVAGGLGIDISRTLYIYNILGDSWTIGTNLPDIVWGAAMGAWDGKLYLVGGTRIGDPYTPEDRVDVYDIASEGWTADGGNNMPTATSFFGSVQTGPYLYAVGGYSGDFENNVDQTQRYNMASNQWDVGPEFTSARGLSPLAASSSHLYMLGGELNGGGPFNMTDLVEQLDLSTWPAGGWTSLDNPLPKPNIYPATECSETLNGGEIWSVGGADIGINVYDTNLYYPIGEPCVGYGVDLPDPWDGEAEADTTVEYIVTITNTGVVTDYYTLEVSTTWDIGSSLGGPGPIGAGESMTVTIAVEVPPGGMWNDLGVTAIMAASLSNPAEFDITTITTRVMGYQVDVVPDPPDSQAGHPGGVLTYTLQVTNIGDFADSYTVAISTTWATITPISVGPLLPGEETEMLVWVEIPQDALHGDWNDAIITLTSQSDPRVSDDVTLTSTAFWHRMLIPLSMKN